MNSTVDYKIKNALVAKGYKWEKINIKPYLGYGYLYGVHLDGKLVEVYDTKRKGFVD